MRASILNEETLRDGVDFFRGLRLGKPVYFDEDVGMFIVTRSTDIAAALRQPELFSVALAIAHSYPFEDVVRDVLSAKGLGPFERVLPQVEPPTHGRVRSLVSKGFSAPRVAKIQSYIDGLANDLVDRFADRGQAEIVTELAQPLPLTVIGDLLCLPRDRSDEVRRWTKAWIACSTGNFKDRGEAEQAASAMADMQLFVAGQLENRRARPADDMMTDLINARSGEYAPLTDGEIVAVGAHFLGAGHETVSVAITHAIDILARDSAKVASIRSAPDRNATCRAFVEEVLRCEPPVNAVMRVSTDDAVIGDVKIPKGSKIALIVASANRDSEVFGEDADQFLPGRPAANRHMSFGGGIHVCLGSMLARAEVASVVNVVVDRLDNLRPVSEEKPFGDFGRVVWPINYRLTQLRIAFDAIH